MKKVNIKFRKDCKFSPDGMHTNEYSKGDELLVSEKAAKAAENANLAEIEKPKAQEKPTKKAKASDGKSAGGAPENKSK